MIINIYVCISTMLLSACHISVLNYTHYNVYTVQPSTQRAIHTVHRELYTVSIVGPPAFLPRRVIQRPHLGLFNTVSIPGLPSGPRLGYFQWLGTIYFVTEAQIVPGWDRSRCIQNTGKYRLICIFLCF